ncbi:MAG: hypothetical protein HYR56_34440 [Acidobacteria bacterium]|nr:hypothetical protein [Acidobacteriota bacterium]MBI3421654.1 hypothetical protein [Acidobacteriota bacterium]
MKLSRPICLSLLLGLTLLLGVGEGSHAQKKSQDPDCCIPPAGPGVSACTVIEACLDQEIETKKMRTCCPVRVTATTQKDVLGYNGRVILPRGSVFMGIASLKAPAESRRRPALIEVVFTQYLIGQGRNQRVVLLTPAATLAAHPAHPKSQWLTSAPSARQRSDLLADRRPNVERNTVLIAGGAGLGGAAGGAVTGTVLGAGLGMGIGAGAGLVFALLAKGRDAVIPANLPIGLRLCGGWRATGGAGYSGYRPPGPRPPGSRLPASYPGSPGGGFGQSVRVLSMRASQAQSGEIQVQAVAEAPNGTWDVFIESLGVQNGILNLRMLGYATQNWSANQRAPQRQETRFNWADPYHRVKRVVIRGAQNTLAQSYIHPLGSGNLIPTELGTGEVDPVAQRVAQQLNVLAQSYERDVGANVSRSTDPLASGLQRLRGASTSQLVLRDALNRAAEAARPLREPMAAEAKRVAVSRLLNRADAVERALSNVPNFPAGYRQSWQAIQQDLNYLADATPGVIRP